MTALMYKKPDDHIKFLEDCLTKAENEKKIQWHTFLDPLPPIPKAGGKISSENEEQLPARKSSSRLSKYSDPLPPISHQESKESTEADTLTAEAEMKTEEQHNNTEASYDLPPAEIDSIIDDDVGLEEKGLPSEEREEIQIKLAESTESQSKIAESMVQPKAPIIFVLGKIILKLI